MQRFDVTIAVELNLDLVLYGLPAELSPERELLASDMLLTLGGSSGIFAHNLAVLGNRVGFISRVGDDSMGQIAVERLAAGVDVSLVRRSDDVTSTGVTVILQHGTWRNILTYPGTISKLCFEDRDLEYLRSARHFHLSSFYLQTGLRPRVAEVFHKLKAAALTISMDTNDDPDDRWQGGLWDILRYVDVFLPNERELLKITGESTVENATGRLAEIVPLVVVKRGAEGAIASKLSPAPIVSTAFTFIGGLVNRSVPRRIHLAVHSWRRRGNLFGLRKSCRRVINHPSRGNGGVQGPTASRGVFPRKGFCAGGFIPEITELHSGNYRIAPLVVPLNWLNNFSAFWW